VVKTLVCTKCGKVIETLPVQCGYSMIYNEETNQLECYMGGECGYISLDEFVCEDCCK
jgi:primosomal protein N'